MWRDSFYRGQAGAGGVVGHWDDTVKSGLFIGSFLGSASVGLTSIETHRAGCILQSCVNAVGTGLGGVVHAI